MFEPHGEVGNSRGSSDAKFAANVCIALYIKRPAVLLLLLPFGVAADFRPRTQGLTRKGFSPGQLPLLPLLLLLR